MTGNRCIEVLKKMKHMFTETCAKIDENTALDMAVEAIKENQAYRAIGTVEGYKRAIEASKENYCLYREYKAKVQQYEAIGTIDECRVAVERMKPLEPIRNDKCTCPKCGTHNEVIQKRRNTVAFDTVYCWHCGQAISIERDLSN